MDDDQKDIYNFFCKNSFGFIDSVKFFTTPFSAITYIYDEVKGNVDLFIVYIENNLNNIMLAHDVQEYYPHIKVIFYSDNLECAEDIFEAYPSYFLKTPIKIHKMTSALERIKLTLDLDENQMLILKTCGEVRKIKYSSIIYMESIGRKIFIYTQDGEYIVNMTMQEMMCKLPDNFVLCHRSYIVNINKINSYKCDELQLVGGTLIPVSRSKKSEIKALVNAN